MALAWFGEAGKLNGYLDLVHQGGPWWTSRLKGWALGALLGVLLALVAPIGGHIEFLARCLPTAALANSTFLCTVLNAFIVGGAVGLFAAGGRSGLVGFSWGASIWLAEYLAYWVSFISRDAAAPDVTLATFNSILIAPLVGGVFGAVVGLTSAKLLSVSQRARPVIH